MHKQAGQWARLYKQVRATAARLHQAEQETSPAQTSPPEFAKQPPEFAKHQGGQASDEGYALPTAESTEADERQAQLRAIANDLLYWKGGMKVLRMAQLPKWRGYFKWRIEEKIDALQTAYATLRAEAANGEG